MEAFRQAAFTVFRMFSFVYMSFALPLLYQPTLLELHYASNNALWSSAF